MSTAETTQYENLTNTRMYDEFLAPRPEDNPAAGSAALTATMVDTNVLKINGTDHEIKSHQLFALNALLLYRQQAVPLTTIIKPTPETTLAPQSKSVSGRRQTASNAMASLATRLNASDRDNEVIQVNKSSHVNMYQINPGLLLVDNRTADNSVSEVEKAEDLHPLNRQTKQQITEHFVSPSRPVYYRSSTRFTPMTINNRYQNVDDSKATTASLEENDDTKPNIFCLTYGKVSIQKELSKKEFTSLTESVQMLLAYGRAQSAGIESGKLFSFVATVIRGHSVKGTKLDIKNLLKVHNHLIRNQFIKIDEDTDAIAFQSLAKDTLIKAKVCEKSEFTIAQKAKSQESDVDLLSSVNTKLRQLRTLLHGSEQDIAVIDRLINKYNTNNFESTDIATLNQIDTYLTLRIKKETMQLVDSI